MSFNRRGGGDRRPDRPRREGYPDRGGGGGRPYPPRDRPPREDDRPFGGRDRPYPPRPRFDQRSDEGGMSIRLDPRRLGALKRLAGEAGVRPGDLVRQWVEERIDAERAGGATSLEERLAAFDERLAALEAAGGREAAPPKTRATPATATRDDEPVREEAATADDATAAEEAPDGEPPTEPEPRSGRPRRRRVSAAPAARVALHDEMIAVLAERGPMPASELATAITERGRYAPPRSGKPLDAAMVSQRASNPTYRSRFTRNAGRIGLAEEPE